MGRNTIFKAISITGLTVGATLATASIASASSNSVVQIAEFATPTSCYAKAAIDNATSYYGKKYFCDGSYEWVIIPDN
jgi:hypothetical protein